MASKEFFNGCKKVVLIACGSFNPPTVMHVRMFEVAKDFLQKKGVTVLEGIFSPAADNYAKKDLAKAKDRLKMCELATKESGWLRADGWECGQKKWTRTLAVLKHHLPLVRRNHAAKAAGDAEDVALVLLCGGDVVDSFTVIKPDGEPLWSPSDVQSILSDFGAVIVNRACSMPKETIKSINLDDFIDKTVHFTSVAPNEVSSTRLREAIRAGRPIEECANNLVEEYIREQKLYLN